MSGQAPSVRSRRGAIRWPERLARALWAVRLWCLAGLGVGLAVGALYLDAVPGRHWTAEVLVEIGASAMRSPDDRDIRTEVARLSAWPLRAAVVRDLNLAHAPALDRVSPPLALGRLIGVAQASAMDDIAAGARRAVETLGHWAEVDRAGDSRIVRLAVRTRDPAVSSQLANRMITLYLSGRAMDVAAGRPPVRIVAPARPPSGPDRGATGLVLGVCGLIGLLAPAALSVSREAVRAGYRTVEELEADTDLPVLGQLPEPADKRRTPLDIALRKPGSHLAEAVRGVRTAVLQDKAEGERRVIVVTSSVPHEGKSTASALLSQNLSAWGRRVLLVEADIRRQSFRTMFSLGARPGLLSVLAGLSELDETVLRPDGLSIDVLLGEASSTNAADILATQRFPAFLAVALERYDYVVIDTPPVLVVPDARIVAPFADAVLYTVQWEQTRRALVHRGLEELRLAGARPTGLILNRVDQKRMERYGYGLDYGDYGRKSGYYTE